MWGGRSSPGLQLHTPPAPWRWGNAASASQNAASLRCTLSALLHATLRRTQALPPLEEAWTLFLTNMQFAWNRGGPAADCSTAAFADWSHVYNTTALKASSLCSRGLACCALPSATQRGSPVRLAPGRAQWRLTGTCVCPLLQVFGSNSTVEIIRGLADDANAMTA